MGAHREAPLAPADGGGDEVLEHFLHRKQQRPVDVRAGERGETPAEQEQPDPRHHGVVMAHRTVHAMPRPVVVRSRRRGHVREDDAQLVDPLPVRGMAHDSREPPQREVDQPVRGSVRGELVVAHVEAGAVHQVLADVRREEDPPAQTREIRLPRAVRPGEAAPGQQDDAGQEQMDEGFEHVEAADRADAGRVELRMPEPAPVPQHGQEDPAGLFVPACRGIGRAARPVAEACGGPSRLVPDVREVDLRQDLNRRSAARFDDSDVVLRVEDAFPEGQNPPPITVGVGRLRERESFQLPPLVLIESGQRVVLSNDQHAPRAAARAARRRIGAGGGPARGRGWPAGWMSAAWITESGRPVVLGLGRHDQSPGAASPSSASVFVS